MYPRSVCSYSSFERTTNGVEFPWAFPSKGTDPATNVILMSEPLNPDKIGSTLLHPFWCLEFGVTSMLYHSQPPHWTFTPPHERDISRNSLLPNSLNIFRGTAVVMGSHRTSPSTTPRCDDKDTSRHGQCPMKLSMLTPPPSHHPVIPKDNNIRTLVYKRKIYYMKLQEIVNCIFLKTCSLQY